MLEKYFADSLCRETAFEYTRTILTEYSKLLRFQPTQLPLRSVSLKDALAQFDEDQQEMDRRG